MANYKNGKLCIGLTDNFLLFLLLLLLFLILLLLWEAACPGFRYGRSIYLEKLGETTVYRMERQSFNQSINRFINMTEEIKTVRLS
jgi:hypothetical protein